MCASSRRCASCHLSTTNRHYPSSYDLTVIKERNCLCDSIYDLFWMACLRWGNQVDAGQNSRAQLISSSWAPLHATKSASSKQGQEDHKSRHGWHGWRTLKKHHKCITEITHWSRSHWKPPALGILIHRNRENNTFHKKKSGRSFRPDWLTKPLAPLLCWCWCEFRPPALQNHLSNSTFAAANHRMWSSTRRFTASCVRLKGWRAWIQAPNSSHNEARKSKLYFLHARKDRYLSAGPM